MDTSGICFRIGSMAGAVATAAQHRVVQRHLLQQSIHQEGLDGRHRRQFLRAALLPSSQHHRRLLSILSSKVLSSLAALYIVVLVASSIDLWVLIE